MWSGLIPFFSYSDSVLFSSLQHPIIFTIHYLRTVGLIYNHSNNYLTSVEGVNVRDLWEMEVDLRSRKKEKRTLHFFVRGKQQKGFIKGVPDRVEFGVCYFISLLSSFHLSIQICTYAQNDTIEFMRLEELKEPRVTSIDGEEGYEW